MINITIVGGNGGSITYDDDSETQLVKNDLSRIGNGLLKKQNGSGVLSERMAAGQYEYHVSSQGKKTGGTR